MSTPVAQCCGLYHCMCGRREKQVDQKDLSHKVKVLRLVQLIAIAEVANLCEEKIKPFRDQLSELTRGES